ncbi:MAG: alpha/beta hydrolase [Proteobacteria bacterium]|nr:alpha/beta hydrolase [Pseudomonadota bacterium]
MKLKWILVTSLTVLVVMVGVYRLLDPEVRKLDDPTRNKLGGSYVGLSDGKTHYRLEGPADGRTVVLVHGATIPIWTWDGQFPVLTAAGFRVLAFDQYGRGYSDRPDVVYGRELYKRQLLELVDALGITEPFHLVGLSLGGATAVNFTAAYPKRVGKLVLISPVVNNFKAPTIFNPPLFGEFIARVAGVKTIVNRFHPLVEGHPEAKRYGELFLEQTTFKGFQRSIVSMLRNDALKSYDDAYRAVGAHRAAGADHSTGVLKRPAMLIWGTSDMEITPDMIGDIRTFIPHITFHPVEGAGHGIVFQKSSEVNALLVRFFKGPTDW